MGACIVGSTAVLWHRDGTHVQVRSLLYFISYFLLLLRYLLCFTLIIEIGKRYPLNQKRVNPHETKQTT